ncbi:CPBP family intramembrane glutamic endopeptidase [Streptococcus oralis]|uniref:CAAX amino terminal protease n=2 Tax=Streptococcus TaxID=1301 RepID=S9RCL4_STROR|nr:type II CAAX endopeptidase family protein [Streptococcus oralis]EMG35486.1 Protease [Streptococcus oralis subsp. tigurinus 1366]EPX89853.1 CAAX amino terminal protease [Streptococcus oralis subsp. tigurinus 2425]EPX91441.1 CAAX amino terminal protease [Streptococcus oralis subsp. tigurinus 2426]
MKRKETKFYLGTILVLVSYYSIFNLVAKLDSVNQLSDFGFYGIQILLIVIEGITATMVLVKSQRWKDYGRFEFRWPYLVIFFLSFILMFLWVNITTRIFPSTQNGSAIKETVANLTGISYFVTRILYGSLIAPIVEELVFRGLLMTALSKFKRYYIDVIISATLFSLIHVLQYGWVLTDFIVYAGAGLLLCLLFRYTRSIYWSMALHILWNTFLIIVSLLVFGY